MKVRVFASADDVADAAVREVAAAIRLNPSLVLGLPTGRTPLRLYDRLVAWEHAGRVSFSRVTTFNLDEFIGLGAGDQGSYRAFMERHLFGRLRRRPFKVHFLDGLAEDLEGELSATIARSRAPAASSCKSSGSAPTGMSASTSRARRSTRTRTACGCTTRHARPMRICSTATCGACRARR